MAGKTNEELQKENDKLRDALDGLMWTEEGTPDPVLEDGGTNPFDDARDALAMDEQETNKSDALRSASDTVSHSCILDLRLDSTESEFRHHPGILDNNDNNPK